MALKIKDNDLMILIERVKPLDTPERRQQYKDGLFRNSHKVRDLNMRYRWDLLYMSRLRLGDGVGMKGDLNLYSYLNDKHIDAALRSFIPTLTHHEIKQPLAA